MNVTGKLNIKLKCTPLIAFEHDTLQQIQYMVKKHPIECQWFHRVNRLIKDNFVIYYLHDLFIPEQFVGGVDVESSPQMMMKMWQQVKKDRKFKTNKELSPLMQNTSAWCHSHHKMGVDPSPTDNEQWATQKKLAISGKQTAPQIMLIMNKENKCFTRVYDPVLDIEFDHVPIHIQAPESFAKIDEIMKERFKPMVKPEVKGKTAIVTTPTTKKAHSTECVCPDCISHGPNCACPDCKKKTLTNNQTAGWFQHIYDGKPKKKLDTNGTRDVKKSSPTQKQKSSQNEVAFYARLDQKEKRELASLVDKLANTSALTKRKLLAGQTMRLILEHLDQDEDDLIPLTYLLDPDQYYDEIHNIDTYFFPEETTDNAETKHVRYKLEETLTHEPIRPAGRLGKSLQAVMKMSAQDNPDAVVDIADEFIAEFYRNPKNKVKK